MRNLIPYTLYFVGITSILSVAGRAALMLSAPHNASLAWVAYNFGEIHKAKHERWTEVALSNPEFDLEV